MRRIVTRVAIGGIVAMFLLRALLPEPDWARERSATSYGAGPRGTGALFELLARLDLVEGRTSAPAQRLPAGATVWWIEPHGVCNARRVAGGGVDPLAPEEVAWPGLAWIEAGGTAVVLLPPVEEGEPACDAIGDLDVPPRTPLAGPGRFAVEGLGPLRHLELAGARVFTPGDEGGTAPDAPDTGGRSLEVAWPSRARRLAESDETRGLAGWEIEASLDGHPFVLMRHHGAGRLVLVADGRFLRNAELDRGDAAPLAGALVAAFGVPWIDEREHGQLPASNPFRYLARSAAAPVFAGLVLVGLLVAWRGSALPARSVAEPDPAAPTLDTFVASLASHYAGTRDWPRLHERYRDLTAARLRRHFGWAPETSLAALCDRIATRFHGRAVEVGVAALASPRRAESRAELEAAMLTLDSLVEEVARR